MAGNKQQFTLQFNADTSQAKKALQDLNNSLNAMMKLQHFDSGLHQDITEAADAARILQQELQKATDINTGKLNVSDFARGLSQAGTSLNELSNKLLQAGQTGERAFNNLAQSIISAEVPMKKMNAALSNALTTLTNTVKWEFSSNLVHGLESAFSGAVSYAKNLNTSLTNIRIVTGQSVDDMAKFAVQANKAAKELSTTTRAYADASLIYYQQGDSAEEAAKKAAITIKAANASFGTSAAEMSEYLTAVWNSYQVGADELEHYVDIMAALGAKTATSLEEIATSMQKVAATANTVGVSMEQVSSIIATVSSVTRESAESIGTSFKTIFARIGDLKLGKTLEDGVDLGQVSSQLAKIGVSVLDANGDLRDMGAVIEDLMVKWDNMTKAEQTAIAQVVAGKRQYTQWMALMENSNMYEQNMDIASDANGSLQKMANIYAESWEGASARVKASLEGIYGQIIDDQALIKMTNMLADFIGEINNVIKNLGGLPGVLAAVGNIITTVFHNKLAAGFNAMAKSVTDWGQSLKGQGFGGGLKSIIKGESAAMREYQKLLKDLHGQSTTQNSIARPASMDEMKWTGTQKIIEAKQRLLSIEQTLSDTERAAAQHQINSTVESLNALGNMTAEYEEQNKSIQKLIQSVSSLEAQRKGLQQQTGQETSVEQVNKVHQQTLSTYFPSNKNGNKFTFSHGQELKNQTASNIFNPNSVQNIKLFNTELNNSNVSVDALVKRFANLRQGLAGFENATTGITDVLQSLEKIKDISPAFTRLNNILDDFKQSLQGTDIDTSFIDQLQQDLSVAATSNNLDTFKKQIQVTFKTLSDASDRASVSSSGALQFLIQKLNLSEAELLELGDQSDLAAQQLFRLSAATRKTDQSFDGINIKGGKFGKLMSDIVNGLTGALSAFESTASTIANWNPDDIIANVASIGNIVTSVITPLLHGDVIGAAMSAIGAGIGAIVGKAERAKKLAEEVKQANRERLSENISANDTENQSLKELITSFNTLYAQKREGANVDKELALVASKLATEYNITGAAVANLTGDYDDLISRLRQIASGQWNEQMIPNVARAKANFETARDMIAGEGSSLRASNGSIYYGYKSANSDTFTNAWEEENNSRLNNLLKKGYTEEVDLEETGLSTGKALRTYEFGGDKEDVALKNQDGRDLMSFRTLLERLEIDDYFLSDEGYAELAIGQNSSASYKHQLYTDLNTLYNKMIELNVASDNKYLQGISSIISTWQPEMEQYEQSIQGLEDSTINQESNRYLGQSAGQDGYNFAAFVNDYAISQGIFEDQFRTIYPEKDEIELSNMARESANAIIQMNSGLSTYGTALNAAYEIFNDFKGAADALIELENSGFNLEDIDAEILYAKKNSYTDYINAIANTNTKQQIYADANTKYQNALSGQSLLKEDMSFNEMAQLYDAFDWGEDGIVAWEEFYAQSYEDKAAYLNSLSEQYLEASKKAATEARIAAEEERNQAEETKNNYSTERYSHDAIVKAAAADQEQDLALAAFFNKYQQNPDGTYTLKEGEEEGLTETEKIWKSVWESVQSINPTRTFEDFIQRLQSAGIDHVSQEVIDEYNRLVAAAEAAGQEVDDALRNELLWEAMGKQVDSVTTKIQKLTNAITSLPTNGEELKEIAEGLGMDMDTLINSSEADRAAALVENLPKPVLKKSGGKDYSSAAEYMADHPGMSYEEAIMKWQTTDKPYSTPQDYANYAEEIRLGQEANALNAQYKESAIRDEAIETLATIEELSSALSSIDINDLPEQGTKAYEQLQKALGKVNISMVEFMKMNDSSKYVATAKVQNKLIDEKMTLNEQLQEHYVSIMNDTSDTYDEDTRMAATQNYYNTIIEENNLILEQEQNIANARAQSAEAYARQANMAKARMEEDKKEAEELKTAAETMAKAIETGELSNTDQQLLSQTGYLDNWNKAATAAERAALASKAWSQYAADTAKAGEELSSTYANTSKILDEMNNVYAATYNNYSDIASDDGTVLNLQDKNDYIEYLRQRQNALKLTEEQIGHIGEAWDNLESKGTNLSEMTNADITKKLAQELNDMGILETEDLQMVAAKVKDIMADIGKSMAQDHIDAAQEAADAWLSAFETVANARQKLLSGDNLLEDIAGDPTTLLTLLGAYRGSSGHDNASAIDLLQVIASGSVSANQLMYQDYDLKTQMGKYGLDLSYGGVDFGSKNAWIDRQAAIKSLGLKATDDQINKALEEYYIKILMVTENLDEEAALEKAQAIIAGNDYTALSNARRDLIDSLQASALAQAMWNKEQEALIATQTGAQLQNQEKQEINGQKGDYDDLIKLQEAIERAQDAKNKGENWESLSSADRDILGQFNINFDNVDSAAQKCADALLACAQAALKLAKDAANKNNFYENKDGVYEEAMTQDEYAAAYGDTFEGGEHAAREYWETLDQSNTVIGSDGKKRVFTGTTSSELTSAIESAEEAVDNFSHEADDVFYDTVQKMAESIGMTKDEFDAYTQSLYENGDVTEDWSELTDEAKKKAYDFAKQAKEISDAWINLTNNQEDNIKALRKGEKSTGAYRKSMDALKKDLKKIFGDSTNITDDFVEKYLDDIEEMANGSEEAAERVEKALLEDMLGKDFNKTVEIDVNADGVADQLTTIGDLFNSFGDEYADQEIGFTLTADQSPAIAAMQDLRDSGIMTADQIEAALAAIGWDPQIEEVEVKVQDYDQATGYATVVDDEGNEHQIKMAQELANQANITIPVIRGARKTGGGASGRKASGGGGKGKGGGGGGGGGGGKEPKKLDKKKPEDEKERYHTIIKSLDRLSDALEEVDKLKDRAYGKNHLTHLEQEISLLKNEIKLQEQYLDQAYEWLAIDADRVLSMGAVLDDKGNIANYDELMDSIIGKYNEFIDRYNAASASAQEGMDEEKEEWDKWYEERIEWISQYEETVGIIYDKQNEILELQNKISAQTLEKIQYKIEYKVEINEGEKNYLDYINDKYDEVLEKQDLIMDNYIREGQIAEENLSYLSTAREELEAAYAAGDLNQADYVAGLQDIQDQILENLEAIQDVKEAIEELYGNALDLASEELDKHTAKIEAASEAMGSYMSILQLMGKGQTFEDLLTFYQKQYEYNIANLESQMSYLNVLKEEEQYYLDRMNSAEGLTETERIQYEELQETLNDVQADMLSKTEETLQALRDMYNTTIEDIVKDLEKAMVGIDNDLAWLTEEYGFYTDEIEEYVSAQRELYEISKLNRNIQKSINDVTSNVHKKELKALQDEINAQSELKELSEYEIEMMNLKYELLLKQIALEEAQNAKDTVRLTRDSEGNMIYQYTADQDAITQAQQEYEDVLQQMADTNWEYEQNIYNQTLQLRQETLDAIKEIAMDETLTEEQKQQRISEILEHYYERSRYLQEQYKIVTANTTATNELIADHYGVAIAEITNRTKDTIAEIIGEMINHTDNYRVEMENAYELIKQAMQDYADKINEVTKLTNTDYESMIESVKTYDKVTEDAKNETIKMTESLRNEVAQIHAATTAWDNYYRKLAGVIDQYEAMYRAIQQTIRAQSQLANASGPSSIKVPTGSGKVDTTPSSRPSSGGGGGGGGSSGSGGNKGGGGMGKGYKVQIDGMGAVTVQASSISEAISKSGAKASTSYGYSVYDTAGNLVKRVNALPKPKPTKPANRGGGWTGGGMRFATGGLVSYTGPAWVDGTSDKPELVLNSEDTQNMFRTVDAVRQLDKSTLSMMDEFINFATSSMMSNLVNIHAGAVMGNNGSEFEQNVHITAEFPNVQDSNEIQDAFDNLINRAAQYIGSKTR